MNAPPWVPLLRAAAKGEWGTGPRIVTLATADHTGRPRARTVICRGILDDGVLWFASDSRSEKHKHVQTHPFGETVFWLSARREQYRVAGALHVLDDEPSRVQAWRKLSDTARALFFWDPPGGEVREDRDIPGMVPAETPVPKSFEVLVLRPDRAEFLDLKEYPHTRLVWDAESNWVEKAVNP